MRFVVNLNFDSLFGRLLGYNFRLCFLRKLSMKAHLQPPRETTLCHSVVARLLFSYYLSARSGVRECAVCARLGRKRSMRLERLTPVRQRGKPTVVVTFSSQQLLHVSPRVASPPRSLKLADPMRGRQLLISAFARALAVSDESSRPASNDNVTPL